MNHRKIFGENIRRAREEKELTQEQLARCANLDSNYINKAERGMQKVRLDALVRIAQALGIPPSELVKGL